jgi:hypothetical protein
MKTIYLFIFFTVVFGAGFYAGHWSRKQIKPMDDKSPDSISETNDIVQEEYESLMKYLDHTKQKNALRELNQIVFDHYTSQYNLMLAETVRHLNGLRDAQTNDVIKTNMMKYYEKRLDMDADMFSSSYSTLPVRLQQQISLKPLWAARDYLKKYPLSNPNDNLEFSNAFKILDARTNPAPLTGPPPNNY